LQRKMQNEAVARRMHEALAMQVAGLSLKSKKAAELGNDELTALATEATHAQSSPVLDAGLAQRCNRFMLPLPPNSNCASAIPPVSAAGGDAGASGSGQTG
jgi:hypothetical protein